VQAVQYTAQYWTCKTRSRTYRIMYIQENHDEDTLSDHSLRNKYSRG